MAAARRLSEEHLKILQNIEERRGELGLSGPTVAGIANIAPSTWYRRLADPGQFTVDELLGIAEALRWTLAELVK